MVKEPYLNNLQTKTEHRVHRVVADSTMPIQIANESNNSGGGGGSGHEIKVKIAYNGEVMITYIDESITYDGLCREMREICRFSPDQVMDVVGV